MGIEQKVSDVRSEYIIGDFRIGGFKEYALAFILAAAAAGAVAGGVYLHHKHSGQDEKEASLSSEIKDSPGYIRGR